MTNRPFTVGTKCKTKSKPSRFCEIISVDPKATRKNIWVVQFPDDGSTKDNVKSQQLLKLAPGDTYPVSSSVGSSTQEVTASSETSDETEFGLEDEDTISLDGCNDGVVDDDIFDPNPDREIEEDLPIVIDEEGDPRTGNYRAMRQTCMKIGCKTQSHWTCDDKKCANRMTNPNGRVCKGTFYCPLHWLDHHQEVYDTMAYECDL